MNISVCHECRGTTFENKMVRMVFTTKDRLRVIEDVPATVCKQCGEQYFSPETTAEIDTALTAKKADATISAEVVHLKAPLAAAK